MVSIYGTTENMIRKVYANSAIPLMIRNLGFDCEVYRGSRTAAEYDFYGPTSGHSPVVVDRESYQFTTRMLISGDETFNVQGIDIGSTMEHAIVYTYEDVILMPNDYIKIIKQEDIRASRWWKVIDPERVGQTVSIVKNRYYAKAVESAPYE